MATTWVKYEGIAFNAEWVRSKTLREFSEHEAHHGLSKEQFREAYLLCGGKIPKVKTEREAEEPQQQGEQPGESAQH